MEVLIQSSVDDPDLLSRLTQHRLLGAAPRAELEWLVARGVRQTYCAGEVTTRRAQPEEWLRIVLSGHLAIHLDRGAGALKVIEWRGGDVLGLMPYSRGGAPPGDTVVEAPTTALAIHREHVPQMIRECPTVTATLVHAMLDRARHFTTSELHDEKLLSLGKLAAGLAHELNNPASAAARSATLLAGALDDAEAAARALAAARLSVEQLRAIDDLRALRADGDSAVQLSAVERADREETIGGWLGAHGIGESIAAALAEAGVTPVALQALNIQVTGVALDAALSWVAAGMQLRALAADVHASALRIHGLVGAVKGFTYMDQAQASEAVDIRRGITDTLAVLGAKIRAKSIIVTVDVAADLPAVRGFGGELNQVWSNLIDNALDAAPSSGHVEVTTRRELDRVVVQVADDGPGIPREIQSRVFDPFFTTKPVGQGTGLGLDIVRRLLRRVDGEIELESRPGRTEFRVRLPLAAP